MFINSNGETSSMWIIIKCATNDNKVKKNNILTITDTKMEHCKT